MDTDFIKFDECFDNTMKERNVTIEGGSYSSTCGIQMSGSPSVHGGKGGTGVGIIFLVIFAWAAVL